MQNLRASFAAYWESIQQGLFPRLEQVLGIRLDIDHVDLVGTPPCLQIQRTKSRKSPCRFAEEGAAAPIVEVTRRQVGLQLGESGGRLEEYRPFVVGTHGVQHAFLRESLGVPPVTLMRGVRCERHL